MENSNTRRETTPKKKQEEKKQKSIIPTPATKITGSNGHWLLISLNINGLNSPIKRHRITDWILKQDPEFCCKQETPHSQRQILSQSKRLGEKISKQMIPRNNLE